MKDLLEEYPDLQLMNETALLSAAAYDKPEWPTTHVLADYCASDTGLAFDPSDLGWVEQHRLPAPEDLRKTIPAGDKLLRDLKYRVWVKTLDNGDKIAVLAFRGTQSRPDWFANLRWITRIVPHIWDHYEQYNKLASEVLQSIKDANGPRTTIVATGHSLGGGLAQLAGYASDGDIKKVYAYDPSVVTYYYGVDSAIRNRSRQGQFIYRIFEQGEALSYVRWILKRFYPVKHENPRVVQVKFHRLGGGLFRNHSIHKFACAAPIAAARIPASENTSSGSQGH